MSFAEKGSEKSWNTTIILDRSRLFYGTQYMRNTYKMGLEENIFRD